MLRPLDDTDDPLFTTPPYKDTSMEKQLGPERLPEFMAQLQLTLDTIARARKDPGPRVTWTQATLDCNWNIRDQLQRLQVPPRPARTQTWP